MKKHSKTIIIVICVALFFTSIFLDLFRGHVCINIHDLWKHNSDDYFILEALRMPRVIKAVIAGSCLALSGMLLQSVTKDPLVEPYLTGVSSGAGLALVLGIMFGVSPVYYSAATFIGAILSLLVVLSFSGLNKFSLIKLILAGLSVNIFTGSIISALILTNAEKSYSMITVLSGNINSSTLLMRPTIVLFIVSILVCLFMSTKLNFLRLDKSIVSSLSAGSNFYSLSIILLASFLAALSVSVVGIIGFVGIIIPHLSRMLVGHDYRWVFFTNILLGSTLVVISDFISRNIIYPSELPVGLVLALIGAPVFILFLVFRGNKFYA